MIAYDLDGTLADTELDNIVNFSQLIDEYANARVKYRPSGAFIIITARGENATVQRVTRAWVEENLPNCEAVYFTTGSGEAGARRKIEVMKRHNVTEFVDSKSEIVRYMKSVYSDIKYATLEDGEKFSI